MRRLLAIFAHPDDEAFGPAGTLAKYASEGVEIHMLCATRGEAGKLSNHELRIKNYEAKKIHRIREQELLISAKILGIAKVEFLDFIDGTLCNNIYHKLSNKITQKLESFKPQVVVTFDQAGISGHLDHIAVTMTTTYAFHNWKGKGKLYYFCEPCSWYGGHMEKYFIYFPHGPKEENITTQIDITAHWKTKVAAMHAHVSQSKDAKDILKWLQDKPRREHFILQECHGVVKTLPETDLFTRF